MKVSVKLNIKKMYAFLLACALFEANAQTITDVQVQQAMAQYHIAPNATFFRQASSSMEPNIKSDALVVVEPYQAQQNPLRGDMIIFKPPTDSGALYIKRVVAVAGDRVQFKNGTLILNGVAQHEPYVFRRDKDFIQNALKNPKLNKIFFNTQVVTVPNGAFFVLGDNRFNSVDSRSFGAIDAIAIKGKALLWQDLPIDDNRRGEFLRTSLKRVADKLPLDLGAGLVLDSTKVVGNNRIEAFYSLPASAFTKDTEQLLGVSKDSLIDLYCHPRILGSLTDVDVSHVFQFKGSSEPLRVNMTHDECVQ